MHCFSRLVFPTIAVLLATSTATTTPELPVFRANIKDVPGLHSGLTGVVYLYAVENGGHEESSGGPATPAAAYAGYTSGLGGCTGDIGCTIMVSPSSVCIHFMSRAPEIFDPAWENEQFFEEDFSGMVKSENISKLEGKTVISE